MQSNIHPTHSAAITLGLFVLKFIIFNSSRHAKKTILNGTLPLTFKKRKEEIYAHVECQALRPPTLI